MRLLRRISLGVAAVLVTTAYVVAAAVRAAPGVRARKARLREERAASARRGRA